jgi:hypothetical protein
MNINFTIEPGDYMNEEHGFLSIFLTDADYKVTVGNERT